MSQFHEIISDKCPEYLFISGDNNGQYPFANSLLIETDREKKSAILIDCGTGQEIIENIRKEYDIQSVYLSHWHEDHILNHQLLKNARFHCHVDDMKAIQDMGVFNELYGIKGTSIEEKFKLYLESLGLVPIPELDGFQEGDIIYSNGTSEVRVLHSPGHSVGHCCFHDPKNKIIFLSDMHSGEGFEAWYGCLDSNLLDFESSVKKIMKLDIEHAITSHSGIFTGKEVGEKLNDILEIFNKRDERILELMSEKVPKTLQNLEDKHVVYKRYDKAFNYFKIAESIMIKQHLTRLERLQKIVRKEDGYILV
ncbi:MAG: MBL fold metallo-hydrolase [Candidatus Hodarchaeota archaeon]